MGPADAAVEGHREAMASSAPGLRLLRLSKRMRRVSSSQEVLQCRVIIDSTQVYIPLRLSYGEVQRMLATLLSVA
jgi:hypothetical protein